MNQKRKFISDFSFGGYAIFAKGGRIPAFVQVEGSKIFKVSIPKKETEDSSYLHSDCLEYDLRKKTRHLPTPQERDHRFQLRHSNRNIASL